MKKIFPIVASVSILIIALSVTYYLVIFVPSREKATAEQKAKEIETEAEKQRLERDKFKVYEDCDKEAKEEAQKLLESKIEIMEETGSQATRYKEYKAAAEKGLYLRDDYEALYNRCLRRHGLKY